ncbi:TPA: alpha/beta hydrolase [Citrobacter freundii]
MDYVSRETLEEMIAQAVARSSTFCFWPHGEAPGAKDSDAIFTPEPYHTGTSRFDRAVTGIRAPEITVYPPEKPNGTAILVTPGGSYRRVVQDKEGSALAPFFNERGYTLFVMTYRLPGEGHQEGADAPLADAQRAMRYLRANAHQWNIKPERIGVLGFSAGGHLAASLGTRFDESVYSAIDKIDEISARPAFMALVYPVITMQAETGHPGSRLELIGATPDAAHIRHYSPEERVNAATPPTFLLHAIDDPAVKMENSLLFFNALRSLGVSVEMHLFENGKHGFGIRDAQGLPLALWPELLMNWIAARVRQERCANGSV